MKSLTFPIRCISPRVQYKSPLIITDQRAFLHLFIDASASQGYKILWNVLVKEIQYIDHDVHVDFSTPVRG